MKWYVPAVLAVLALMPGRAFAQEKLEIGNIPDIDDKTPTTWGMSGWEMVKVSKSDGRFTPIMRTETFDARTVEILSRTQAPRLRAADIKTMSKGGHDYVIVRRYLLMEVKPQDAAAEGVSKEVLAKRWASAIRNVLPKVAPLPSAFGI